MTAPQLTSYQNQGSAGVNADQLNTFQQTCDTLAQLRTLVGLPGMQVFVRGFSAVGDGGQGSFFWNENGIGPDNATSIIVPNAAAAGVWERLSYLPLQTFFLPKISSTPDSRPDAGTLYVDATGALRFQGPLSNHQVAPP